ncbi:MAG TPA: type II toxin-antitoxin system VapB family antitoxin [Stellaceae bacterium]|nr:type II toxin-antitoxin system VapB family antitoxin [Stellaceae bacterium]
MALQIANPVVVGKIEALARATGLSKTAAVEKAVDRLLTEQRVGRIADVWERFDALLAQMDQIPDLPTAFDPLEWDEHGLPR